MRVPGLAEAYANRTLAVDRDLNEIILPSESRGGKFLINRAAKFQEVIWEWCLLDLGLQGLDRALNDCYWRIQFPEAFVEHLCRLHLDHNPIFLLGYCHLHGNICSSTLKESCYCQKATIVIAPTINKMV